jgi:DNA-binding CsgD family transcriptional regulator
MDILETMAGDRSHSGIVILNEFLEPIQVDENAYKLLSLLAIGEKPPRGSEPCLPLEISLKCEELLKTTREQEQAEPYEQRLILDIPNSMQQIPIRVRLIRPHTDHPAFIICLDLKDPGSCLKERLSKMGLSKREEEVAGLVCEGLENVEISNKLFISSHTVEGHLKSIYRKLGVRNRTSLVHRIMTPF